jgi:hypothetical protein
MSAQQTSWLTALPEVVCVSKTFADLGYTVYDRSFVLSRDPTPSLSEAPLTLLIGGFADEIKQIFGGTTPPVGSIPLQSRLPTTASDRSGHQGFVSG